MDMPVDKLTRMKVDLQETLATVERLGHWRRHIETALHKTRSPWTFDDILDQWMRREIRPVFWEDAFLIGCIQKYPTVSHYHIFMVGGNLQTLIAASDAIIEDAQRAGCQRITAEARRGWERSLKRFGVTFCNVKLAMEVPDG